MTQVRNTAKKQNGHLTDVLISNPDRYHKRIARLEIMLSLFARATEFFVLSLLASIIVIVGIAGWHNPALMNHAVRVIVLLCVIAVSVVIFFWFHHRRLGEIIQYNDTLFERLVSYATSTGWARNVGAGESDTHETDHPVQKRKKVKK